MEMKFIQVEEKAPIYRILLNRPPVNVLNIEMIQELTSAVESASASPDVSVLVITGGGEKGFSAGADIQDHLPERVSEMLQEFHRLFQKLGECPAVTVAGVHGYCLGGGCELALFCDFVIADESARFGQPEIEVGCFPPVALALLPHRMSVKKSAEWIFTGKTYSAQEAVQMGLVNRLAPAGQLETVLQEFVSLLTSKSPAVLKLTKKAFQKALTLPMDSALMEMNRLYLEELTRLSDMVEGLTAFLQKRKPVWTGR